MKTINCKGNLLSLDTPVVMGIINMTPDSFYDKSRKNIDTALETAEKMIEDGAKIIDVGGYSSRPNADEVPEDEELKRIIPFIEKLVEKFPNMPISVDTFRAKVAKESIEAGAAIVNDIASGGLDPQMWNVVSDLKVPYIAMHMRGNPKTMQQINKYSDMIGEMIDYFWSIKQKAKDMELNDLIIDPGFGFSKDLAQNYHLMEHLQDFDVLDLPILVGISRKSMIYNLLNTNPQQALNGTSVLNTIALLKGADIIRVHDVKEAVEVVKIVEEMKKNK